VASNEFIWVQEYYEEDPMVEDYRREAMLEGYGEITPDMVYGKHGTRK